MHVNLYFIMYFDIHMNYGIANNEHKYRDLTTLFKNENT